LYLCVFSHKSQAKQEITLFAVVSDTPACVIPPNGDVR